MRIRLANPNDLDHIRAAHAQYYAEEFPFPDFSKFHGVYIIDNENGYVTAGGVRLAAESIILTDKAVAPIIKVKALHQMLAQQAHVCGKLGVDQLHCWIDDEHYSKHLQEHGFVKSKGEFLVLNF